MIGDGGVPLGCTLFAWAELPRPGRDNKKSRVPKYSGSGGRGWIRTTEALSSRFTVCPHWPLGNTPIFIFAASVSFAERLVYFTTGEAPCQEFFQISFGFLSEPFGRPFDSPPALPWFSGPLAYFITEGRFCQRVFFVFLPRPLSADKILFSLVFFQAVLYNNVSGDKVGRGVLSPPAGICLDGSG